ncbi:hypothetical protein H4582DRAFT_1996434, partial [Lactarius indigo]
GMQWHGYGRHVPILLSLNRTVFTPPLAHARPPRLASCAGPCPRQVRAIRWQARGSGATTTTAPLSCRSWQVPTLTTQIGCRAWRGKPLATRATRVWA